MRRVPASAEHAASTTKRGAGLLRTLRLSQAYRALWLSTVFTQIAQWMLQVSLGWLMLNLTDSAFWIGLNGLASGVPFLLVALPVGPLLDRVDRRALLIACQASALIISFGLAVVTQFGAMRPWIILLGAFLNGLVLAVNNTARQIVVPALVPRSGLQNAIGLLSAGQNATRIVGPSLAGPLIAVLGSAGALFVQAGCLTVALLNTMQLPPLRPDAAARSALLDDLVEGVRYVLRHDSIIGLLVLAAVPTVFVFPYLQFLPIYARDLLHLGARGLGWLYAAGGVGALAGSLFVAGAERVERKGWFILVTTVVYGGVIILFAYSHWTLLSLCCLFWGGFLGSAYMALNNTLLHLNVTDAIRGRVMSLYMMTWGLSPLGALPMGYLGAHLGVPHAIALGALLSSTVTVLVAVAIPSLRTLR